MGSIDGGRMKKPITHKFKAKAIDIDGYKFPSKKEGVYYQSLKNAQARGYVLFFLRQVPLHLPGGVKMVIDFVVFMADGTVRFTDVKGMRLRSFIDKKRIVEAIYPIEIEEV
jgi:hypothetical protein